MWLSCSLSFPPTDPLAVNHQPVRAGAGDPQGAFFSPLLRVALSLSPPGQIHWLSIINSFVLVLILTVFLGIILMKIIKTDLTNYMDGDEVGLQVVVSCARFAIKIVVAAVVLVKFYLFHRGPKLPLVIHQHTKYAHFIPEKSEELS